MLWSSTQQVSVVRYRATKNYNAYLLTPNCKNGCNNYGCNILSQEATRATVVIKFAPCTNRVSTSSATVHCVSFAWHTSPFCCISSFNTLKCCWSPRGFMPNMQVYSCCFPRRNHCSRSQICNSLCKQIVHSASNNACISCAYLLDCSICWVLLKIGFQPVIPSSCYIRLEWRYNILVSRLIHMGHWLWNVGTCQTITVGLIRTVVGWVSEGWWQYFPFWRVLPHHRWSGIHAHQAKGRLVQKWILENHGAELPNG